MRGGAAREMKQSRPSRPRNLLQATRRLSIFLSVVGIVLTALLPAIEFTMRQQRLHQHHVSIDADALASAHSNTAGQVEQVGIPHALVFTYKHNLLQTKGPALLYNNVMETIRQYQQLWNDPQPAEIRFLDDPACRLAIQQSEPKLMKHFDNEKEGKYRADICRVADLYNHGGYYFDVDLLVIEPIKLDPTITFSSVLSGFPNWDQFFQAFLATTPQHPVLKEALQIMLRYYEGNHTIRGKNVGTSTLKDAYDAIDEAKRGPSKLLVETKNTKENEAKGEWYYPDVPKLDGVGCCCDQICHDPEEKKAYFYARIPGSGKYCRSVTDDDKDNIVGALTAPAKRTRLAGGKNVKVVTIRRV